MKQCPTCNRTYADETLTYCLDDGSLLSAPYDSEATQRIYPARVTNPPPTEALPSNSPHTGPVRPSGNSALLYIIVALLALIVGGGAVALLKSRDKDTPVSQSPTQLSASTPTP